MYDSKEYISKIHPNHGKSNEFLRNYFKEHGDYYEPADDQNYKEAVLVESINLSDIGECGIIVFENDFVIPHFHIIGDNFETALCILHPLYYDYHDIDILNDNQINELVSIINNDPFRWNWLCMMWDGANLNSKLKSYNKVNYAKMIGGKNDVFWSKYSRKHKETR